MRFLTVLHPVVYERPQLGHVLEREIECLEPGDRGLGEVAAAQLAHGGSHVTLGESELDSPRLELFGEVGHLFPLAVVGALQGQVNRLLIVVCCLSEAAFFFLFFFLLQLFRAVHNLFNATEVTAVVTTCRWEEHLDASLSKQHPRQQQIFAGPVATPSPPPCKKKETSVRFLLLPTSYISLSQKASV